MPTNRLEAASLPALRSPLAAEEKGQKAVQLLQRLIEVVEAPDCAFAMSAYIAEVRQFLKSLDD